MYHDQRYETNSFYCESHLPWYMTNKEDFWDFWSVRGYLNKVDLFEVSVMLFYHLGAVFEIADPFQRSI